MLINAIKRRLSERLRYASMGGWLLGLYNRLLRRTALPLPFRGAIRHLRLKGIPDPFYFRLGTTDLLVLEEIFFHGEYDALLPYMPAAARLIVDLGANTGYSLRFWHQHFPQAAIIAVEPDSENAKLCHANVAAGGGAGCVEIVEACVGATERTVHLETNEGEWAFRMVEGKANFARDVPAKTIPQLLARNGQLPLVDLLKCDIEGAEAEIFSDCKSWIQNIQNLVIELHPPYTSEKLLEDLKRAGAKFKVISRSKSESNPVLFLAGHNPIGTNNK